VSLSCPESLELETSCRCLGRAPRHRTQSAADGDGGCGRQDGARSHGGYMARVEKVGPGARGRGRSGRRSSPRELATTIGGGDCEISSCRSSALLRVHRRCPGHDGRDPAAISCPTLSATSGTGAWSQRSPGPQRTWSTTLSQVLAASAPFPKERAAAGLSSRLRQVTSVTASRAVSPIPSAMHRHRLHTPHRELGEASE
jgi:hypothetical protein